ncbi:winged helix-turn-helix domain-containing protein (plasmid) [Aeromonas sp. BC14]|nr:winged helix-turn-helix domain-containing protein [Aeromonas sp. BC14]WAF97017.1 winged helix-turn-helix domain-containing protein [Aeromonas sp. BC14]
MSKGFLIDGSIAFEPANYKMTINNKEVRLSQKECQVLEVLCTNCNVVVERNLFIEPIWGSSASGDIGLNKAILLLRRKFESHDLPNLINTVPRVGYTLNASVSELLYTEDDTYIDASQEKEQEDIITAKKIIIRDSGGIKKRTYKIAIATIAPLLMGLIISLNFLDNNNAPVITSKTQTGLSITYTSSEKYGKPLLTKTNEYLSKENNYYFRALLSTEILSFILYKNKTPVNQQIFTIDQNRDMDEQLSCIDNYLSKNITAKDEPTNGLVSGMIYSSKEFYSYCKNNTVSELGILYTKGTRLAHGSDKDHMMLQDFLLRTPSGEEIFHIKRYVNHLGFGTDNMQIVQKSVMSDNINMNLIHTNELYSGLLSELTKDNVIHTRIEPLLYISEIFGGMLFYSKDYH